MTVWFELPPGIQAAETADPFVAVALLPAMARAEDLDLSGAPPVSEALLQHLETIQDIWTAWNPLLHRIAIRCHSCPPHAPLLHGAAAFFSGGIDATFTAIENRDDLQRLVYLNGFDFRMTADEFAAATGRVRRQASGLGVELLAVETNWIDFTRHHRIARSATFGSILAGTGLLLAPERMLIPASSSYDLMAPHGSHMLLDPLWSNGTTRIEQHGCHALRSEKTAVIADHPDLLSDLWVCHHDPIGNCGDCPKCLRLRMSLWFMGKDALLFPGDRSDPVIRWCRVLGHGAEGIYLSDYIEQAQQCGRMDAVRCLRRAQRRRQLRRAMRSADAAFLGGFVSRWRNRNNELKDLCTTGRGPMQER